MGWIALTSMMSGLLSSMVCFISYLLFENWQLQLAILIISFALFFIWLNRSEKEYVPIEKHWSDSPMFRQSTQCSWDKLCEESQKTGSVNKN